MDDNGNNNVTFFFSFILTKWTKVGNKLQIQLIWLYYTMHNLLSVSLCRQVSAVNIHWTWRRFHRCQFAKSVLMSVFVARDPAAKYD